MPAELRGPPKVLQADGHSFSDVAAKVVSIINLASVAAIETVVGVPVHPLRFRANLYVDGWPAWHEFSLVGQEIAIGAARLKVTKRIVRCAATNVDPDTGIRDLAIPATLMQDLRSRGLRHLCAGDRGRRRSRRATRSLSIRKRERPRDLLERLALGRDAPAPHDRGRADHQGGAEQIAAEQARARAGVDQRAEQRAGPSTPPMPVPTA